MARNYVNNKDLYEAMCLYNQKLKLFQNGDLNTKPVIPNYVGEAIMLICNRLSYKYNFINYTYRDEMISDGIENCIVAVDNFNPEKSNNPFAYFTQIAFNAFVRRILKEKKQSYIKHKNFVNSNLMEDIANEMANGNVIVTNEYSDEIISSFEEKKLLKLNQAKIKKQKIIEDEHEK